MFPWLFNVYMDAVMKEVKMGVKEDGNKISRGVERVETDDMVMCGESEENLKVIVECFVEVGKKRNLKVTANKSNVTVLDGEEGLEYEIHVDGTQLEFKYLGCILEESGTDVAECRGR